MVDTGALNRPPRHMIRRWGVGDAVTAGTPAYVTPGYWTSELAGMPNPPAFIDEPEVRPWDHHAEMLWWDGDTDLVLLHFPQALAGTGHAGHYDSEDDEPFYDLTRTSMGHGCLFVPTSALDLRRMGLIEFNNVQATAQYKSDHPWPRTAMYCNLAQYRIPARVMAEFAGVSRQAVHKSISRLPRTIRMMTGVYGGNTWAVSRCAYAGCMEGAASPISKYCHTHFLEVARSNAEHGRQAPQNVKGKPRAFSCRVAEGTIDDFLPLVDQTGE